MIILIKRMVISGIGLLIKLLSVIMNEVIESAKELKSTFEELSLKSDAVMSGYNQNKEVISKAIQGVEIAYHLSTVNLGCLRVLVDDWDLERSEYNKLLSALATFDEALKKQYG